MYSSDFVPPQSADKRRILKIVLEILFTNSNIDLNIKLSTHPVIFIIDHLITFLECDIKDILTCWSLTSPGFKKGCQTCVILFRTLRGKKLTDFVVNSKNFKSLAKQVRAMSEQVFEILTRAFCPLEETVFPMLKRPGMILQFEELTVKSGFDTIQAVDILLNSTVRSKILIRLRNLVIFEVFGVNFSAQKSIFQDCPMKRARGFYGQKFHSKNLKNHQIEVVGPKLLNAL